GPEADEPGQLGDPDDLFVRDVADIRVAHEGQRVMLAEGDERNGPLHDLVDLARCTALAFGRKRGEQLRIALVAVGRVVQGADEAARGLRGPRGGEIQPERPKDLGCVTRVALPLLGAEVTMCPKLWRPDVVV